MRFPKAPIAPRAETSLRRKNDCKSATLSAGRSFSVIPHIWGRYKERSPIDGLCASNEDAWYVCVRAGHATPPRRGIVYWFDYLLILVPPCFSRFAAPSQQAARVFRVSHAGPLPGVQFLPPCDEAAGWTWTNDETSPSLTRHPNEKSEGNSAKDNQRQSQCDANLEPLNK